MKKTSEIEVADELDSASGGWKNLYMFVMSQALKHGDFVWPTERAAIDAALSRSSPEETEYLGAFKEGQ